MMKGYFSSPRPYEIIGDPENQVVWVGKTKYTGWEYYNPRTSSGHYSHYNFAQILTTITNDKNIVAMFDECAGKKSMHGFYKYTNRMIGSKPIYRFNAAMYNTFLKHNFNYKTMNTLRYNNYKWYMFDWNKVSQAILYKDIIHEVEKDNLYNIIPYVIAYGKSPQELRQLFGKGLWKKIVNSSYYRNNRVAWTSYYYQRSIYVGNKTITVDHDMMRDMYDVYVYTLEYMYNREDLVTIKQAMQDIKGHISQERFDRLRNIDTDLRRMLEQLGRKYNPKWSLARKEEEHAKATRDINRKKYSPEPFDDTHEFEIDGYKFKRLISPLDIRTEGDYMGHCVGSYATRAAEGSYIVYEIDGKERATLGIRVKSDEVGEILFIFDQCYQRYNRGISDELRKVIKRPKDGALMQITDQPPKIKPLPAGQKKSLTRNFRPLAIEEPVYAVGGMDF